MYLLHVKLFGLHKQYVHRRAIHVYYLVCIQFLLEIQVCFFIFFFLHASVFFQLTRPLSVSLLLLCSWPENSGSTWRCGYLEESLTHLIAKNATDSIFSDLKYTENGTLLIDANIIIKRDFYA